jgi:hypothetical protein
MKRFTFLFIFVLMFTFITAGLAGDKETDWDKFSQSLVKIYKCDNDGLKQSAMQKIIKYSDKLDVQEAAYDIYKIYKWHKDFNMRRLALVTLSHIKYDWAMKQLARDIKTEESPALKNQMIAIVKEYNQNNESEDLVTK